MTMVSDVQPQPPAIRRPRQKRSRERFEAILDAAERLLNDHDPDKISIYTVADEAGMSPASIYHFFPDGQHIFIALAERYFDAFISGDFGDFEAKPFSSWQEWIDHRYAASRSFFNRNHAASKVLLGGAASSWTIRSRDLDINEKIASRTLAAMNQAFIVPQIPGLVDRMVETIVLTDALWALANHKHGSITDEAAEYSRRARLAHMRTYLPEYLPLRERSGEVPAT